MGENIVLGIFAVLPMLLAWVLQSFFRKKRLHKRGGIYLLVAGNTLNFLFLCSTLILFGEVYFRFIYDSTESFGLQKTTVRWFQRHFHHNNAGFRDSIDYQLEIKNGQRRVTFLGDSFTAGHGIPNVEDRFSNLARGSLSTHEVHVLAVCGWDTGAEIVFLKSICQRGYELDSVVLVYCLNDIADISRQWQAVLERIRKDSSPGPLVENSYLFNTIYYRWKAARDPDISDYYQFVQTLYQGRTWENQKRRLQLLRDEVRGRGGQLLVVTFPFFHALEDDYRYERIHKLLDSFWLEMGVPHLDLLPVYKPLQGEDLVVSKYDAHPNERAHSIAAKAIVDFLDRQARRRK